MTTPTPEQIDACMAEAARLRERVEALGPDSAEHAIADALATRDAEIAILRADLTTAHRERDEARRALAECAILSGDDTDGNTLENGGWVHLWRGAVDAVRQLRADYDEAIAATPTPAPAFKVGDRVTAENVGALPVGTVVRWEWAGRKCFATRTARDRWTRPSGSGHSDVGIASEPPTYIHSLPTPEKP